MKKLIVLLPILSSGCLTVRWNSMEDDGVLPPKVNHTSIHVGVLGHDQETLVTAAQAKAVTMAPYYNYGSIPGFDFRAPSERGLGPVGETGGAEDELHEVAETRRRADAALKAAKTAVGGVKTLAEEME